jgi:phosphate transport system substrate-binding protein
VLRLEKAQLHRLFSGQITDWRDVGGRPGPVRLYARDDNSGTYDTFKSLVLGKAPLAEGARRFESNADLSDAVAGDPNGIGFVGLPYVRAAKAVAISDGESAAIVPEPFSVATEDYALTRRLFLYLPQKGAKPMAREFAEFTASPAGQEVVARVGFVSQQIVVGDPVVKADAPAEYRSLIREAQRLSLNFRFRAGSIDLDNKALRDVSRLVEFMKREENRGRELMLYGFADRHERIPLHSLELSVHRADRVADLLIRHGLSARRVRGFGSAVPVASNETPEGRFKNRRVEVWVR